MHDHHTYGLAGGAPHPKRALVLLLSLGAACAGVEAAGSTPAAPPAAELAERYRYAALIGRAQREWDRGDPWSVEEVLDRCPAPMRGWEWHFLRAQCRSEVLTLSGTGRPALFADGSRLLAGFGSTVKVWDLPGGRERLVFTGHNPVSRVTALAFSPAAGLAASAAASQKEDSIEVRVWDPETGQTRVVFERHTRRVDRLAFSPDGSRIASADSDGIHYWDPRDGREIVPPIKPESSVSGLAFDADGRRLALAIVNGTITIGEVGPDHVILGRRITGMQPRSAEFSPDGHWLAAACDDGSVRFWDASDGRPAFQLEGHRGGVAGAAFSPQGRWLASCGRDRLVRVWDLSTRQEVARLPHVAWSLSFSPDGRWLASSGGDVIKVWDASRWQPAPVAQLPTDRSRNTEKGVAAAGRRAAVEEPDGKAIALYDLPSGRPARRFVLPPRACEAIDFSPDGRVAACALRDCTVLLVRTGYHEAVQSLIGHESAVRAVRFSPDGRRIATVSDDGTARLWSVETGREAGRLIEPPGPVVCLDWVGDGSRIATGHGDGTVRFWETATGRELGKRAGHTGRVSRVVRAGPRRVVSAGEDGLILVLDADASLSEVARVTTGSAVRVLAASPDGRRLISAGDEPRATLREADTGVPIRTLGRLAGAIHDVDFSPDGRWVATADGWGAVSVWSVDDGRWIRAIPLDDVREVSFPRTGETLVAACSNAATAVIDLQAGRIREQDSGYRRQVSGLVLSPDGSCLVAGGKLDGGAGLGSIATVDAWDTATGAPRPWVAKAIFPADFLAFSGDGRRIVGSPSRPPNSYVTFGSGPDFRVPGAYYPGGLLTLWDAGSGEELLTIPGVLPGETNPADDKGVDLNCVNLDRDGRHLAAGGSDGIIRVWDTTVEMPRLLDGFPAELLDVAASPDGRRLAATGRDGSVTIRDLGTGETLRVLHAHDGMATCAAFLPDGRRLVTGGGPPGGPGELKLWDVESGRLVRALPGHAGGVTCVAITADGKRGISGAYDRSVHLTDLENGAQIARLVGHVAAVTSVAFSPDGARAATAGFDRDILLWRVADGRLERTLRGHRQPVRTLAFAPGGGALASAGDDSVVLLWDLTSGRERILAKMEPGDPPPAQQAGVVTLATGGSLPQVASQGSGPRPIRREFRPETRINRIAFSSDGQVLASADDFGRVRTWDVASGRLLRDHPGHEGPARAVAVVQEGRLLLSAGHDRTVRVGYARTARLLHRSGINHRGIIAVTHSPDGRWFASAGADGRTRLWDSDSGRLVRTLEIDEPAPRALVFSPDGRRLAVAGDSGVVRMADVLTGCELLSLASHGAQPVSLVFSTDGVRLTLLNSGGEVWSWDAPRRPGPLVLEGHEAAVQAVSFSPDGRRVASADGDGRLLVWDLDSGRPHLDLAAHRKQIEDVEFSPDGRRLASASQDRSVRVWDAETGARIRSFDEHRTWVGAVAFSPDGKAVASAMLVGSGGGPISLFDIASGRSRFTVNGGRSLAFSPAGDRFYSGFYQRVIGWSSTDGEKVLDRRNIQPEVSDIALGGDGKRLGVSCTDGTARVLDADSGKDLLRLNLHASSIGRIAASRDGTRFATAAYDGSIAVWDARDGTVLRVFRDDGSTPGGIGFSPNGRRIASGHSDHRVRIWEIEGD